MRLGKFEPHQATLRLKMDLTSGNPYMWDPVAYRVLKKHHVRTGAIQGA
jgi:glutaminyl-tRNA synthetase